MQSGRLRERVAIQAATVTQNTYGEEIESWATSATVWAQVLPGSVSERFQAAAGQRASEITHTVRMRFRSDITPKKRLLWETRTLEILGQMDPTGKRDTLVVMCKEELRG